MGLLQMQQTGAFSDFSENSPWRSEKTEPPGSAEFLEISGIFSVSPLFLRKYIELNARPRAPPPALACVCVFILSPGERRNGENSGLLLFAQCVGRIFYGEIFGEFSVFASRRGV